MIGIIDYGIGNIKAFENIYRKFNISVKILKQFGDFDEVTKLILPGVGAFDHAMNTFNNSGMRQVTEGLIFNKKVPIIGICVGMQMMALSSDEGSLPGLGWIEGRVKKLDVSKIKSQTHLPHTGWNDVNVNKDSPIFKDFPEHSKFYFLHSYYFECNHSNDSIASADYGIDFTCAVNHDNIFGVQFHPEKSHHFGTQLLENFAKL